MLSVKRMFGLSKETHDKKTIDTFYHEPYINTGYRKSNMPWGYYIGSLFQPNNETMNSWTHFVGFGITIIRFMRFSSRVNMINDPYMWPMLVGFSSMAVMYLGSTIAHLFSNKSKVAHHTGFACDYAGISMYGLGSTIMHYMYCANETLRGSLLSKYIIPVSTVVAIAICICGGISKVYYTRPYPFTRKLWLMIPVGTIYTLLELPIIHRLFRFFYYGERDNSLYHHGLQIVWFLLSATFFGSHIPEKLFPGKFDIIGSSHQLFHICILIVTNKQLDAVEIDMQKLGNTMISVVKPTFWNTFGAAGVVALANALTIFTFNRITTSRDQKEAAKKNYEK